MLKGISNIISPELLKILMEMGHGDELVFGDGNFPAASYAHRIVRADGHKIKAILEAILPLFPLDYSVDFSAVLMSENGTNPSVWSAYREVLSTYPDGDKQFLVITKPEFYERVKKAYCVVATGESEKFANLIIRKGVICNS